MAAVRRSLFGADQGRAFSHSHSGGLPHLFSGVVRPVLEVSRGASMDRTRWVASSLGVPSAVPAFSRADQASMWSESSANNFGALRGGGWGHMDRRRWSTELVAHQWFRSGRRQRSSRAVVLHYNVLKYAGYFAVLMPAILQRLRGSLHTTVSLVLKRKLLQFRAVTNFLLLRTLWPMLTSL